jgi:hypothetical protein
MKYNRSYYCKQIAQAVKHTNKGKKVFGNELRFWDDLDWEVVENRGVWTDVYLQYGGTSVFAFTVSSSLSRGGMTGSVPEAIRDLETGLWDLYIHKKYISQKDVGEACRKWVELQAPIKEVCMGCNVYFNKERMGHVFTATQYPSERIHVDIDDVYALESVSGPIRMPRGVCS